MGESSIVQELKRIASSITGVSTPLVGVSWNPPRLEVDVARNLLILLSDKRALQIDHQLTEWVVASILEIRPALNQALTQLQPNSKLTHIVVAMRHSCHWVLNALEKKPPEAHPALATFQRRMVVLTARMVDIYGLDAEFDHLMDIQELCAEWEELDPEWPFPTREYGKEIGMASLDLDSNDLCLLRTLLGTDENLSNYDPGTEHPPS